MKLKTPEMQKTRNYYRITSLLIILALGICRASPSVAALIGSYTSFGEIEQVELFASEPPTPAQIEILHSSLTELHQIPLYQTHPVPFFIILDTHWTTSAGFYSRELKNEKSKGILISPAALQNAATAKRVMTHELAHLYFDQTHDVTAGWLSEGLALAFESQENAELNLGIRDAFDHPEISLTGSFDPRAESYASSSHQAAQYGNVQLFFQFLYRRCGKEKFLERLLITPAKNESPFQLIFNACTPMLPWKSFNQIFKAYALAKHTQDYLDPDLYVIKSALNTPVLAKKIQLPEPYSSSAYHQISGKPCSAGEIVLENQVCLQIRYQ